MLMICPICLELMSSHAYETHRNDHDPTNRPFMCESGCTEMFFKTADELQMHQIFLHEATRDSESNFDSTTLSGVADGGHQARDSRVHFNAETKKCSVCDRTVSMSNFRRHMSTVHNVKTNACTICGMVAPNMERHMLCHDKMGRPFQCNDGCAQVYFERKKTLQQHRRRSHKIVFGPMANCAVCGLSFAAFAMKAHMVVHNSDGRPFKCDDGCKETFHSTRTALLRHRRDVHCSTASGIDDPSVNTTSAMDTSIGSVPIADDSSINHQSSSSSAPVTDVSMKERAPIMLPTAPCTVCRRNVSVTHMGQHMKCHSSAGRPFECTHGCLNTFFIKASDLKNHRRSVHNIMAETTCTVCGVENVKPNMTQHMLAHDPTGRPFECTDGCVQTFFTTRDKQNRHRRVIHKIMTDRSIIGCTVCGKTFSTANMVGHMMTHNSDGRPFKCDKGCKETFFVSKKKLIEHQSKIHNVSASEDHEIQPTDLEIQTAPASPAVVDIEPIAEGETSAGYSIDSMEDTSTEQSALQPNPIFPNKRSRETPIIESNSKTCPVCRMVVKRALKLHMTVHNPSDFPCTLGCVETFACSANALRIHIIKFHATGPARTSASSSRHRRSPSSSSLALKSESSTGDSEDEDWTAPKTKKLKTRTVERSRSLVNKEGIPLPNARRD